jgi:hypothetical protein
MEVTTQIATPRNYIMTSVHITLLDNLLVGTRRNLGTERIILQWMLQKQDVRWIQLAQDMIQLL